MLRSRMLTPGFKVYFGIALFGLVGAFAFGITTELQSEVLTVRDNLDQQGLMGTITGPLTIGWKGAVGNHLGYTIWLSMAVVAGFLAFLLVAFRDADPEAVRPGRPHRVGAADPGPRRGVVPARRRRLRHRRRGHRLDRQQRGLLRRPGPARSRSSAPGPSGPGPTGPPATTASTARSTTASSTPCGCPIVGAALVAFVVLGLSRVLLAVPNKASSSVIFGVAAVVFFAAVVVVALLPKVSRAVVVVLLVVGALAVLGGGIYGIASGPREVEHHGETHEEGTTEGGTAEGRRRSRHRGPGRRVRGQPGRPSGAGAAAVSGVHARSSPDRPEGDPPGEARQSGFEGLRRRRRPRGHRDVRLHDLRRGLRQRGQAAHDAVARRARTRSHHPEPRRPGVRHRRRRLRRRPGASCSSSAGASATRTTRPPPTTCPAAARQDLGRDRLDHPPRAGPARSSPSSPSSPSSTSRPASPTPSRSRSTASSGGGSSATTCRTRRRQRLVGRPRGHRHRQRAGGPGGSPVALTQTSNDVIHSFWIPGPQRQEGRRAGHGHPLEPAGRHRRRVPRPVHRVLRPLPRQHAHARAGHRRRRPSSTSGSPNQQEDAPSSPPAGAGRRRARVFKAQLCSSCHLIRGVNDDKHDDPETGVERPAGLGRRPGPHPLRHPRHVRRVDLQQPLPEPVERRERAVRQRPACWPASDNPDDLPICPPANQKDSAATVFATAPGNPDNPTNPVALADWLRNPPEMKPMAPEPDPEADERRRGMPNLDLTEEQIEPARRLPRHPQVGEGTDDRDPACNHRHRRHPGPPLGRVRAARPRPPPRRLRPPRRLQAAGAPGSPRSTTSTSASCTARRRCSSSSSAASRRC